MKCQLIDQDTVINQVGSDSGFATGYFNSDRFKVNVDGRNTVDRDVYGMSLSAEYTFSSGHTLTSVTAYRDLDIVLHSDVDGTPNNIIQSGPFSEESEQLTQELRLASPGGEFLDYVAGLYYYRQDAWASRRIHAGGLPLFYTDGPVDTEAMAAFINADFNVTDQLTLTGGVRITNEEKEGYYLQNSFIFPQSINGLNIDVTEVSWTGAANYKWTEDVASYLTVSRGFKSGGFNADPLATFAPLTPDDVTFDPEFVTSYEAGIKADLADGRARISAAVFFSDYEDRQVPQIEEIGGFSSVITRNAAEAEIQGVELEFTFIPKDRYLINGGISYIDSEYSAFANANAAGDDFTGNATERTPRLMVNLGGEYRHPIAHGEFMIAPQFAYVGKTWLQPDNGAFNKEDGYVVWNIKLGYETGDGKYGVFLWGKNIFQEEYKEMARQFQGNDQVIWGAPRTYGIELVANL